MDKSVVNQFMYGAVMMASWVVALFFLKFWHKTRDRFFALFASAFFLMALERCCFVFMSMEDETKTWIFLIRLLAFSLIITAVVDKNRS